MARAHIPFVEPAPLNARREIVELWAREVATHTGFEVGQDMRSLVDDLGGRASYAAGDAPHQIDLEVFDERDFEIYNSQMVSLHRRRFTLALGVGFYILHYPRVREMHPGAGMQVFRAGFKEPDAEVLRATYEANWFASELLMPAAEFLRDLETLESRQMAIRYNVSKNHAEIRTKSLLARRAANEQAAETGPAC